MTDEVIRKEVLRRTRAQAVRDGKALRLVGAAVTVAAHAEPRKVLGVVRGYTVPKATMERLLEAVRDSGFKV